MATAKTNKMTKRILKRVQMKMTFNSYLTRESNIIL